MKLSDRYAPLSDDLLLRFSSSPPLWLLRLDSEPDLEWERDLFLPLSLVFGFWQKKEKNNDRDSIKLAMDTATNYLHEAEDVELWSELAIYC